MMEPSDLPMPQAVPGAFERRNGDFLLSADRAKLQMDLVRGFLSRSYWANNRSREVTERTIANSLCFGIYRVESANAEGDALPASTDSSSLRQVAFARVISDYATFAWLCDVFVAEEFRGHGLGKWLVESALAHPDLQGLRRWMLATADAHDLYRQFGFVELAAPERWMERFSP
jgi:GNAT superfamily N-acetyltransferase